jgi:hypothetical protein
MNALPKRIPRAHLPQPGPAPEGGWFGTGVQWPTEDLDIPFPRYLHGSALPGGPAGRARLQQVLDGLRQL